MNNSGIEIDDATSSLLDAIADAADDPLLLATLADIDPDEFRRFMAECGEDSREAVQLLKAAEVREVLRARGQKPSYRTARRDRLPNQVRYAYAESQLLIGLTYALIGGGIGAILALLFAPRSGQELRGDLANATRKGIDKSREAAQQLGDRAGEYYEATRVRAAEHYTLAAGKASDLYTQAAEKVGEVEQSARETAARQTSTMAAAYDAGKKAYLEEKRRAESAGRNEAAPNYPDKTNQN